VTSVRRCEASRAGRLAAVAAVAAILFAPFCASPDLSVEVQPSREVRPQLRMGRFNAEERLARGEFLEVEDYFQGMPRAELEKSPQSLALYGKALLARGDLDAALPLLTRALELEARPIRRGELDWALSQAFLFWNEPALALEFAEAARRDGYGLVSGFLKFLDAVQDLDLYAGPPLAETHEAKFSMSGFDLIRLPVSINGSESAAIVDTGAAYTILTESFGREVGVREIPDSKAFGRGLHAKEFPLTFGIVDRLDFAGFLVRNVPVMLMPDDALLFETSRGKFPVPMVLGLHLIKQFTVDLDYGRRRLRLTRADFRGAGRVAEQNLFLSRGRLFVRASINRAGWYQLLLDTGSEPTMLTSTGVKRAGLPASNKFYPKTLYGLGRSQAEWARVDSVTIGVSGFAVRFRNLVVKQDEEALEDGILGNSFLKNFLVHIDFRSMKVTLAQP
jgi:predicted aspartyl protease